MGISEPDQEIPFDRLPVTAAQLEKIIRSVGSYAAAGIDVTLVELTPDTVTVVGAQHRLTNGNILSNNELYKRIRDIFEGVDLKIHIKPAVYSLQVRNITTDWILQQMEKFGIRRNDLVRQLGIDKSYLSLLFAEAGNPRRIELSRPMRALFFYYFLTYEINADLRDEGVEVVAESRQ